MMTDHTDFVEPTSTELPVRLIQTLQLRVAWLDGALESLLERQACLRRQEWAFQEERARVTALLETYRLLEQPAPAAEGTEAPQAAPEASDIPDLSALPQAAPEPLRSSAVNGEAPLDLAACVEQILRDGGPVSPVYLRRAIQGRHGLNVPSSTLHDHLMRGLREGRYAKTKHTWRLARQDRLVGAEVEAGEC